MIILVKYIILFAFCAISLGLFGQNIDVQINNMRNTKGDLCIAIFADQAGFKAEKPILEMKYKKNKMPKGEFRVIIQIKEGKYGLSVLDDENENGRMNYNILGIPQEGFGFSNYLHKGIKIPAFNDFSFIVEKNNIVEISVTMKYFNH